MTLAGQILGVQNPHFYSFILVQILGAQMRIRGRLDINFGISGPYPPSPKTKLSAFVDIL